MGDYSYCSFQDGWLCTWGLHHHGYPTLMWDTLVQTGYGDTPPDYYGRLFEEHGLQRCEVYVDIPSHPVFPDRSPWSTWAIGADMSDAMEKVAHMALTALCSQNLAATAGTPISLYPVQDLSDPEWRARMDEASNFYRVHHHSGWAYMSHYAHYLFQLQHDTQCIVAEQRCRLVGYAKEVENLTQEISRMAQENGVVRQQVRDLESHIRDKDEALLISLRRSSERDQELLRHCVLLRTAEEAAKVKSREFEEFQTVKDLEIQNMQEELEELEEEVQDRGVTLANRDNMIDNLQAELHELQQHQAPAPVAPAEDADPTSDVDES
jgi:hypothetical protein